MTSKKKSSNSPEKPVRKPRRRPATTPEEKEKRLISMAMDLAEEKLTNGTASSQLVCHFLKMGSSREALEQENLRERTINLQAKTESIHSDARVEELYKNAMDAMRIYTGHESEVIEEDEDL